MFKKSVIGMVECKFDLDPPVVSHAMFSEEKFTPDVESVSNEILTEGLLSKERQQYLFNRVCEFVKDEAKDLVILNLSACF